MKRVTRSISIPSVLIMLVVSLSHQTVSACSTVFIRC